MPVFGEFLPFFSADLLNVCQVGWGASLHSFFKVSPEVFDRVQVRAQAGPLKDIQRLVLKPLLCFLGGVLVVLLEGEPLSQSEVLSALWSRFLSRISLYLTAFIFPSILTSLPVPAAEKISPQLDAATTMLHRQDGARLPPDVNLGIQAKEFNLGFIRPENLVSHCLKVF